MTRTDDPTPPPEPRATHGRHCPCSACAAEDWTRTDLAPCGMHGTPCPPVYAPMTPPEPVEALPDRWHRVHKPHDPACPYIVCKCPPEPVEARAGRIWCRHLDCPVRSPHWHVTPEPVEARDLTAARIIHERRHPLRAGALSSGICDCLQWGREVAAALRADTARVPEGTVLVTEERLAEVIRQGLHLTDNDDPNPAEAARAIFAALATSPERSEDGTE